MDVTIKQELLKRYGKVIDTVEDQVLMDITGSENRRNIVASMLIRSMAVTKLKDPRDTPTYRIARALTNQASMSYWDAVKYLIKTTGLTQATISSSLRRGIWKKIQSLPAVQSVGGRAVSEAVGRELATPKPITEKYAKHGRSKSTNRRKYSTRASGDQAHVDTQSLTHGVIGELVGDQAPVVHALVRDSDKLKSITISKDKIEAIYKD